MERVTYIQREKISKGKTQSRRLRPFGSLAQIVALLILLPGVGGCRGDAPSSPSPASLAKTPPAPGSPSAVVPAVPLAAAPRVVFLGDSLTAGLGLGEEAAYPALVGELLAERGVAVRIVNAGVSGDTSAGGLARVDWLLTQKPEILVVALGANDGLRGQPVAAIEANLREIVRRARAAGSQVVLAGMKMPPNYGPDYTRDFEALYARLARELALPFIPFLLEGVAADPALNQVDGIHPTAEGQRKIADLVINALLPLLQPSER